MADIKLRCSLRYAKEHGSPSVIVGWPFASMTIADDYLTFASGRLVPGRKQWQVSRLDIQRIEPTQRGIRLYAAGFDDPWVVASLLKRRFLAKLREGGIEPIGPVVPSTWTNI